MDIGGVEVQLHAFLTLALDGDEWEGYEICNVRSL